MDSTDDMEVMTLFPDEFRTAHTRLLITANIEVIKNGGRGHIEIEIADGDRPNRIVRASVHQYRGADTHIQYNSCTAIVYPNEKYKITVVQTNPTVKAHAYTSII